MGMQEEMEDGDGVVALAISPAPLAFLRGPPSLRTNPQGGRSDPHLTDEETKLMHS